MNLLTYAQRCLGASFDERPLAPADLCLLNELAYLPLDALAEHHAGFVHGIGVGQLAQEFITDSSLRSNWFLATGQRLQLLKLVAASQRFSGLRFYHYAARQDASEQVQFAALTLVIPGVHRQVVFRGTDDTLIGWKEDFHLAARQDIPAQALAVEYLSQALASKSPEPVYVTGHSKGGHLAVHAASVQSTQGQDGITQVLAFDAPGFVEGFLDHPGYQRILGKLVDIIPVDSIVGRLMYKRSTPEVVTSGAFGLMQHSIFLWRCTPEGEFMRAGHPTPSSDRVEQVTRAWLNRHTPEEIQQVVDICFALALDEGYTSLLEITQNVVPFVQRMKAKSAELDPESYALAQECLEDYLALWRQVRSEQKSTAETSRLVQFEAGLRASLMTRFGSMWAGQRTDGAPVTEDGEA
ncbi:Mbeg1-like protein [Rothia nasimurium]|uniref:Mbeg1-like protein n=1 Tax=Rothia nasimurium TaxID=85336 RepID=UPI001F24BF80|nr:Mbeg1-like protein [Rothia nasimurium]